MEAVNQINLWRKTTRLGLLVMTVIELAASYGFISLSINNGNLICYLITILLVIAAVKSLTNLIKSLIHHDKFKN